MKKIIQIILLVIALIIGVILGIVIQSRISIELDNKIRYSELLNWATTVFVGLGLGYILKNKWENNKTVKSYLLDDLKNILLDITSIRDEVYYHRNKKSFTKDEQREITSKLNALDKKLKIFSDFLKDCYNDKHKEISEKIGTSFNDFNKSITNDIFYQSNIASDYYDGVVREAMVFENIVRRNILKIINI